jgi:hypothetical protein
MEQTMDETEAIRRLMLESGQPARDLAQTPCCEYHASGGDLANSCGGDKMRWDTAALAAEFEVIGFMAPFVVVRRKADGKKGSMEFTHSPRLYFNFVED